MLTDADIRRAYEEFLKLPGVPDDSKRAVSSLYVEYQRALRPKTLGMGEHGFVIDTTSPLIVPDLDLMRKNLLESIEVARRPREYTDEYIVFDYSSSSLPRAEPSKAEPSSGEKTASIEECERQKSELSAMNAELKSKIETIGKDRNAIADELSKQMASNAALIDNFSKERDELKAKIIKHEESIGKLSVGDADIAKLTGEKESLEKQYAELNETVKELEKEKLGLNASHDSEKKLLKEELDKCLSDKKALEQRIIDLENDVASLRSKLKEAEESFEKKKKESDEKHAEAVKIVEEKLKSTESLKKELEGKDKEINELKQKHKEETERIIKESVDNRSHDTVVEDSDANGYKDVDESIINQFKKEIVEKEEERRALEERYEKFKTDVQTEISGLEKKIQNSQKVVDESNEKVSNAAKALQRLDGIRQLNESKIKTLEEQNKECEDKYNSLLEDRLRINQSFDTEKNELKKDIEDLKGQLIGAQRVNSDLKNDTREKIETLNKEHGDYDKKKDATFAKQIEEKEHQIIELTNENEQNNRKIQSLIKDLKDEEKRKNEIGTEKLEISQLADKIRKENQTLKAELKTCTKRLSGSNVDDALSGAIEGGDPSTDITLSSIFCVGCTVWELGLYAVCVLVFIVLIYNFYLNISEPTGRTCLDKNIHYADDFQSYAAQLS